MCHGVFNLAIDETRLWAPWYAEIVCEMSGRDVQSVGRAVVSSGFQ